MIGTLRVLDGDAHVVEPLDLFGPWMPPGHAVVDLPSTTPMTFCRGTPALDKQVAAGFDAPSYLLAMDGQGIDAAVLYPSIGLFAPFQPELDPEASAAACRAYNDWISGWCATDPGRLAAVGLVPLADPDLAAEEARRSGALGLVGVLARPNFLYGRNLGDSAYRPLYRALEDTGLVLAVHEGLGLRGPTIGSDRFAGFAARHACSHPMEQMAAMASLLLEGTLERHPALRVAFLESGTGWLPYWLHRLDDHHEWLEDTECADLPRSPSAYFRQQCVISTDPEDHLAAWTASQIGVAAMLWASDFPHPDALYPDAATTFVADAIESGMAERDLAALLWDAPVAFYRLGDRFANGRARAASSVSS